MFPGYFGDIRASFGAVDSFCTCIPFATLYTATVHFYAQDQSSIYIYIYIYIRVRVGTPSGVMKLPGRVMAGGVVPAGGFF